MSLKTPLPRFLILGVTLLCLLVIPRKAHAQTAATDSIKSGRRVTPVITDDNAPQQPVLHYYDKHGEPLKEPVYFLADLDTIQKPTSKPVYPLLNSVSFGVNFFDAVMLVAGQKHASFDFRADLSLHNWFFPVVEAGIGYADSKPETGNFHYKGKPSFYGKIGIDYNFLYKSNPDYKAYVGFRAGFSSFRYDITDITVDSPYWQESQTTSILNQRSTSFYGEALAGLRVKIGGPISLGWTFGYHFKFHTSRPGQSDPWFIPGFGTNSPIHATFSIYYTLPLAKKKADTESSATTRSSES